MADPGPTAPSPSPADPGRRTVVTTMRDEGPHILEWLAYHRLIGFTDILAFSNDCLDGTDAILDRLAAMGLLAHHPNPREDGRSVQWQALRRAAADPAVTGADWVWVADADEFLNIRPGAGRLDDLLAAVPADTQAICAAWRMFGNGGIIGWKPALRMAQFVRCAPDPLRWPWRAVQFKTLFRPAGLRRLGVHRPTLAEGMAGWVDGNGAPMAPVPGPVAPTEGPRYGLVQVNHYALGSAEGFLVKAARGRPNRMEVPITLPYWVERNLGADEDRTILRWQPAVEAQIHDWLSDPPLAALVEGSVRWWRQCIAQIQATPAGFRLFAQVVQAGPTPVLSTPEQLRMLALAHRAGEAAHGP